MTQETTEPRREASGLHENDGAAAIRSGLYGTVTLYWEAV
jgi:hypothetical protein